MFYYYEQSLFRILFNWYGPYSSVEMLKSPGMQAEIKEKKVQLHYTHSNYSYIARTVTTVTLRAQ